MKNFLALIAVLSTLCLSGCLGGAVSYPKTTSLSRFHVEERGVVISEEAPPNSIAALLENPSPSYLEGRWGEPDEKHTEGELEVWRYKGELRLVGAVGFVGAAVPLIFPAGRSHVDFYITQGKIIKAVVSGTATKGGYYGPESEAGGESKWRKMQ